MLAKAVSTASSSTTGDAMSDPLVTYLHDHMGASKHAADLKEGLRVRYQGESLGDFAGKLFQEVREDRAVLSRSRRGWAMDRQQ